MRTALDHLAQHDRAVVWGPGRHSMARNLFAYVRMPEEHTFVELFCDMELLRRDHEPRQWPDDVRSSNAGARSRRAPTSASTTRRSASSASS